MTTPPWLLWLISDFIVRTKILLIPIRWYPRVGTRPPKWQKFPHFGKESPRILWLIATITRKFYAPNYREFRECVLHLTWFASLVTESLVRNRTSLIYPEIFSAPCRKKCALDRKMIHTLLSDSTSSIARQSLREIVIREPALGAKIWCFFTGMMPQSGKLPVLNLIRPKVRFFATQWRLAAPIHVKLGTADGHLDPLGCAKFLLKSAQGWECGPKNIKKIHFLVKNHLAKANPLTDF